MITHERLKELIEQESGCYVLNDYITGYIHLKPKYEPETYENGEHNYILYIYCDDKKKYKEEIFDEQLFETEEEAEWNAKTSHKRIENFEPLYYDDIDQNYCYDYYFSAKNHHEYLIRVSGKDIILFWLNCDYKEYYKNTKEEYEKLVLKCVKKFLGEEE